MSRAIEFAVVNPGGKDPTILFPDGPGIPGSGHPPVNYHAYAACLQGGFYQQEKDVPETVRSVLVLLRRDLKRGLKAVRVLKKRGIPVYVTLKETGIHQAGKLLSTASAWNLLREILAEADGGIAATPWLVPVLEAAGARRAEFVPTPYPVEFPAWNLSRPVAERQGIFVGTREFDVPSRNHLAAVSLAAQLAAEYDTHWTVINSEGRCGERMLRELSGTERMRVISGKRNYPEYLQLIGQHRVILQCDQSRVPGQVAGDGALVRVPSFGGNGAVDELLQKPMPMEATREATVRWLGASAPELAGMEEDFDRSVQTIGFEALRSRLDEVFGSRIET